jgi:transcriptional regulator of acetoin/glycerol metabolism
VFWFVRREAGEDLAIDPAALRELRGYAWPGNVRELEAAIGSACVRARESGVIRPEHLPDSVRTRTVPCAEPGFDLTRAVRRTERKMILRALSRAGYRRSEAARLLGIGRNTFYEKMRRLGISPQSPK